MVGVGSKTNVITKFSRMFVSGRCIDGINNFTCICDAGYEGKTCDIDYDDCSSSPCVHGTNTFALLHLITKLLLINSKSKQRFRSSGPLCLS